jgi:hypothetical protein
MQDRDPLITQQDTLSQEAMCTRRLGRALTAHRMRARNCTTRGTWIRGFLTCTIYSFIMMVSAPAHAAKDSVAPGQNGAGSIPGKVTDSKGTVTQGTPMHVVKEATAVVADTKTIEVCIYRVPWLFAGTYSPSLSTPEVRTIVQTTELNVSQWGIINAKPTRNTVMLRLNHVFNENKSSLADKTDRSRYFVLSHQAMACWAA